MGGGARCMRSGDASRTVAVQNQPADNALKDAVDLCAVQRTKSSQTNLRLPFALCSARLRWRLPRAGCVPAVPAGAGGGPRV